MMLGLATSVYCYSARKRVGHAHASNQAVQGRDWKLGARHCPSRWMVLEFAVCGKPEIIAAHCRKHVTHTVPPKADDI